MLEIIVWMLAGYMILKAIEFVLIARNAPEETRASSARLAALGFVLAVVMAAFFVYVARQQASQMPSMPSYPSTYP